METFTHVIEILTAGLSYRQTCKVMEVTRSNILRAAALLKLATRRSAGHYTWLTGAVSLEALSKVLQALGCWAYSVAADTSAQIYRDPFLSMRIRVIAVHGKISTVHNVHMVAPPLKESHIGSPTFSPTVRLLNAQNPEWRAKLEGATSDGASNMCGKFSGWQTLLQDACESPLFAYLVDLTE